LNGAFVVGRVFVGWGLVLWNLDIRRPRSAPAVAPRRVQGHDFKIVAAAVGRLPRLGTRSGCVCEVVVVGHVGVEGGDGEAALMVVGAEGVAGVGARVVALAGYRRRRVEKRPVVAL
jgi:hypothetical protein